MTPADVRGVGNIRELGKRMQSAGFGDGETRQQKQVTKIVAAMLMFTLVAGCGPEGKPPERESGRAAITANDQPMPGSDLEEPPQREAQFRFIAKEMFQSLFEPSCDDRSPGFWRDGMLGDERNAVSAFERSLDGKPGSVHIKIAKADAVLEGRCSMDSDPEFAAMHVSMTKEEVGQSLRQMRELAPLLHPPALAANAASTGGEFRSGAKRLVWAVTPSCQIVDGVPDEQVLGPAREKVLQFRKRLSGTDFAAQFEIAESDVEFERSITRFTCFPPETRDLEGAKQASLHDVEQMISELEVLIRP